MTPFAGKFLRMNLVIVLMVMTHKSRKTYTFIFLRYIMNQPRHNFAHASTAKIGLLEAT